MTNVRRRELERVKGARLTVAEQKEGWHFCAEFDEDLIQGADTPGQVRCGWCGFDGRMVSERVNP